MNQFHNLPIESYRNELLVRLINFFPDLAQDTEFVEQRSLSAAKEFQKMLLENGASFDEADRSANAILYSGLVFSPFATIKEALRALYPLASSEDIRQTALEVFGQCQPLFDRYPADDYFESTLAYQNELLPELTAILQQINPQRD